MKMGSSFSALLHPAGISPASFSADASLVPAASRVLRRKLSGPTSLVLIIFALCVITDAQVAAPRRLNLEAGSRSSSAPNSPAKHLTPLKRSDVPEGSRITLSADTTLNDYMAYRDGERFYVLIPKANAPAVRADALQLLRGPGLTEASVERRGDDVLLSFLLEPRATVRVNQSFNRLDVIFALPPGTTRAALTEIARAEPTPTPAPIISEDSPAQNVTPTETRRAEPSTPSPTTDSSTTTTTTATPTDGAASTIPDTTTPGATAPPAGAIKFTGALPPEKAQPVRLARFEKPPTIDGKLDDEVWKGAAVLKDFYQTQPGDNIAPSKPTVVMLGYDAKTLYIAFHAYDEPDKVRATVAKRDDVFEDDTVRVLLDTFNDKRRAYSLVFNPFGVQADGILTEGRGEDYSLDIVMDSKGILTSDGYTVEVAIPFKSLRYEAGKDKYWGLHAFRRIKRFNNEQNSWMPLSRENNSFLAQEGRLGGLEGISTERTLEIIPSLTISETGKRKRIVPFAVLNANPALTDPGRLVNEPLKFDPGVTAKFGITPTVTLDFAWNPDFAQVEADQTVVTTNQRFPIFFEEKRPFFLEGVDYFSTPLNAVHTRTIVDPDVAAKLTGKRGPNTFGLLVASDNAPGNFSKEELEDPDFFRRNERFVDKNAYIGVLRLKRDVGKESSIGLIATTYNFIEKHNHLAGFDGRFKLDPKTIFQFQVLGTNSRRLFYDPDVDRRIYRTGNAFGYYWLYDYTGRNFGYFVSGQGRTQNYRADVGFTRRFNTNLVEGGVRFSTDPKTKATIVSHRLNNYSSFNFDWQARSQNWFNETVYSVNLSRQTFLQVGVNFGYERIFETEFGARRSATQLGAFFGNSERSINRRGAFFYGESHPSKKYSGYLFLAYASGVMDLDFGAGTRYPRISSAALADPDARQDPGAGNALDIDSGFTYQPTDVWRSSLSYTKSRLVRHDTGLVAYDVNIFALRSTYQFTRFTFARARIDYDTLASNVRGQFLLGWTPNPGTSLYIGYNDDLNLNGFGPFTGELTPGFRRNGRTFFIKMSYLFRRSF